MQLRYDLLRIDSAMVDLFETADLPTSDKKHNTIKPGEGISIDDVEENVQKLKQKLIYYKTVEKNLALEKRRVAALKAQLAQLGATGDDDAMEDEDSQPQTQTREKASRVKKKKTKSNYMPFW